VSIPAVQGSILAIREGKYVIGGTSGKHNSTYTQLGNLWALNLDPKKGAMGSLLWNKTFTPPETVVPDVVGGGMFGGGTMSGPTVDPEDGVFLFNEGMTRRWWGFSLDTMQMLWGPTASEPMMNFYGMDHNIYQGKLFSLGYSGVLMAYDIKTGKVLWNYTAAQVGFESPYGNYQIGIACIADGKLYLTSGEHSPTQPLWRGSYLRCINASNGVELWKINNWGAGMGGGSGAVIADGYIVSLNLYDNQIYCYGKGPSATTVSASPKVVANESSVLIEGTVTDQSPGAKDTPAISDASMSAWMEYLYMQQSCPTDVTGVPVKLEAFGADGSYTEIGTVTSDAYGNFKSAWTPPDEGLYTIMATFAGSKSYGSSYAGTGLSVGPTPAAAPEPEPVEIPAYPDYTPMFAGIIVAVVAAIVIGIVNLLMLRKRK
jgi:hypothetical protein